ncbi:polyprenol phosphomannose-dependent alpha 1,6 mannosyltransferase MptB [Pseudarthrobacter sp. PS3-L1]|uniref:polyprenol phosphomannose-dependent alpha 1,6 mannosyltransferase MptB n=1 Tax=Pseudarthrobacter sp. PS3-L1 TaxID=3046207 RepID=UPI0024B95172|nr:polyprenol phosphomannose-dependent alpha 1,6 mannosyltransferase MptB [Pseudarthrobacter sp. PS3-L1]MDJ0319802.1 polyprenol phosphomannose-dependent alpha 1,6 mannosyltransferase MptB [Pseudarthrobacter sp. PS3-L1]
MKARGSGTVALAADRIRRAFSPRAIPVSVENAAASSAASPAPDNSASAPARAHVAIIQGFVGSFMMLVGSIGAGWIANGSPMIRHWLVITLRTDGWGVTMSTVLLTVGAMLLTRSWLRLGQRLRTWGPGALKSVTIAVAAWSAPMVFAVPIYSRDVYAYTGQGRLVLEGQDPYTTGISSLSNWFALGADPAWAENKTPYGPYFLWLARGVVSITGAQPDWSVLLFRLLAGVGVLLCVIYVPKLAELHGISGARALWIAVANPLFLISFVASAHNDALMVGLAVVGVYFAATGKHVAGILLVTASIGIKPITVILLPFLGLMWAGPGSSLVRKFLYWGATAGLSFGVLLLSGIPYGLGLGWTWAILDPTPGYTGYSPSGLIGQQIEVFTNALGLPGSDIATLFRTALKWLSIVAVLTLMFRGSSSLLVRRLALAFGAVVMLAPIIQPWYVLWFIPFLAVTGIRNDWQIKILYVVITFFVVFGAQDQLSVWSFVELNVPASSLASIITLAFTIYLLVLDPHTRKLLIEGKPSEWLRSSRQRISP